MLPPPLSVARCIGLAAVLLCAAVLAAAPCCASPRQSTARALFPSLVGLHSGGDLSGRGSDDFVLAPPGEQSMFVVSSDYLARGRAYTLAPFSVAAFVSGAFLGPGQPRVGCAFGNGSSGTASAPSTMVSCGVLHTEQFRWEWITNGSLPLNLILPSPAGTSAAAGGVELISADLDGDGADEIVSYSPLTGLVASYALRTTDGKMELGVKDPSVAMVDSVLSVSSSSSAYALARTGMQLYAGAVYSACSCPSSLDGSGAQCAAERARRANGTLDRPPVAAQDPDYAALVAQSPPNLSAAAARPWALRPGAAGSVTSTSLLFLDPARGVIQSFASCASLSAASGASPTGVVASRVILARLWVSGASFVGAKEQLSVASIRGRGDREEIVLVDSASGKTRCFAPSPSASSMRPCAVPRGDRTRAVGQAFASTTAATGAAAVEFAWVHAGKSKPTDGVVSPRTEGGIEWTSAPDTSSSSTSRPRRRRADLVILWGPARARMVTVLAAVWLSSVPLDRTAGGMRGVDPDADSTRLAASSAMASPPQAWMGQDSFKFSFTQHALSPAALDADPDNDALSTRIELGGLDPGLTGRSLEPLHSYGCSPFRRDVLVEVDWMADAEKTLFPRDGFADPAVQDFAAHNVRLHVFLSNAVPRVEDLGGTAFTWDEHFYPLKAVHFTPSRRGIFHYCMFLDKFGGSTVSGQSATVPGNDFFVSLGGWAGGRGTLVQQQGTFLHELGHNVGLLHGGGEDVNWKPNHLSVMNYLYQVSGVRRDGNPTLLLADMDCDELAEAALDETKGVRCRVSRASSKHTFTTIVNGKWHAINESIDFNGDGVMEKSVEDDLNGDGLSVLHSTPNEYRIMEFHGLNSIPPYALPSGTSEFSVNDASLPFAAPALSAPPSSRSLLSLVQLAPIELSFEQFERLANESTRASSHPINAALAADALRWWRDLRAWWSG